MKIETEAMQSIWHVRSENITNCLSKICKAFDSEEKDINSITASLKDKLLKESSSECKYFNDRLKAYRNFNSWIIDAYKDANADFVKTSLQKNELRIVTPVKIDVTKSKIERKDHELGHLKFKDRFEDFKTSISKSYLPMNPSLLTKMSFWFFSEQSILADIEGQLKGLIELGCTLATEAEVAIHEIERKVKEDISNLEKEQCMLIKKLHENFREILDWAAKTVQRASDVAQFVKDNDSNKKSSPLLLEGMVSFTGSTWANLLPKVPRFLTYPLVMPVFISDSLESSRQVLHSVVRNSLYSSQPGYFRLTLIDNVGFGKEFANFTELLDYPSAADPKIWTTSKEIESKLLEFIQRIEIITQKCLGNRYQTITEFNLYADSLAEPYWILAIASFPHGFTKDAIEYLKRIMAQGGPCGISVIGTFDKELLEQKSLQIIPNQFRRTEFNLGEIFNESTSFEGPIPGTILRIALPENEHAEGRLKKLGDATMAVKSIALSPSSILPQESEWGNSSSADGLEIPIGISSTRKPIGLDLGKGTAHHALIAGRTGSGKSTLIHMLLVNAIMKYPPNELELYLLDFKKGVEFQEYARQKIAHARAIAIESEREFGISTLRFIETEVQRRAQVFRESHVQNLSEYRKSPNPNIMPRILLVIDEFQELFAKLDSINSESARLLDFIGRQGRAFGVHMVLCSQSLRNDNGPILPQSVLDQIAVRIALMSSEDTAREILGSDNDAARFLSKPGESIYNAASGRPDANQIFRVAYLEKDNISEILKKLASKYATRNDQVIFAGNFLGRITNAPWLGQETLSKGLDLWIGEPVSIKEHVKICLNRIQGANVIIIGNALRVVSGQIVAAIISASKSNHVEKIYVANYLSPDSSEHAIIQLFAEKSNKAEILSRKSLPGIISNLADEVKKRSSVLDAGESLIASTMLLVLSGLHRIREIMPDEMTGYDKSEDIQRSLSNDFGLILRQGPEVGIHIVMWCDSVKNLKRVIGRQLKDCVFRIVFQMSEEDSMDLLLDSSANKLGDKLAIYADDESGHQEKFRPYALPEENELSIIFKQNNRNAA